MISNPPYGKSWKTDLGRMGGKEGLSDPRFIVRHAGDPEFRLITRSSDGQLLFLVNKLSKMKADTPIGSRIAVVHNGSALFTGDAGQGESNIRRWILENDWLEAVIALPEKIFYNTGIATYIWVLANKKPAHRKGRVQLIDASQWYAPLRRNLGKKNCELGEADIQRVLDLYLDESRPQTEQSRWFSPADFGYWSLTVERPLRLKTQLSTRAVEALRYASGDDALRTQLYARYGERLYTDFFHLRPELEALLKGDADSEAGSDADNDASDEAEGAPPPPRTAAVPEKQRRKLLDASTWVRDRGLMETARAAQTVLGDAVFEDHNAFCTQFDAFLKAQQRKLSASDRKALLKALSWRDEQAAPVVAKRTRLKKTDALAPAAPYSGTHLETVGGEYFALQYEPDPELRDTERVPLTEPGGVEGFFAREVLPHVPDAWIARDKTQIGYEISFARYFYKPAPLRSLEEIRADILKLEQQSEGLLKTIVEEL